MIFQNNNCTESLVLIPGWATDFTVFGPNFLKQFKYNFIFPETKDLENPFLLVDKIKQFVGKDKINLLGWSMGAFLAIDYAQKYGAKKVFLYGISQKYDLKTINEIKIFLKQNPKTYFKKFYEVSGFNFNTCFTEAFLINGLDYLAQAEIKFDFLDQINSLQITNSLDDKIAIFDHYPNVPQNIKIKEIFLKDGGHICGIQI
jgi:pimeloyl-ACP methyl ester carboxylesterase